MYEDVIQIVNSAHERRLIQDEERLKIIQRNATKALVSSFLLGIIFGLANMGAILGFWKLLGGASLDAIAAWFIPSMIVLSMIMGALLQKYAFNRKWGEL